MQLRRAALPLSLLALLASAGCVSVGAESGGPGPARGSVPPADAPDATDATGATGARHAHDPPQEPPLPLGELPEPEAAPEAGPEPAPRVPPPARRIRPPAQRPAKPVAPRRARPAEQPPLRVPPPPRGEELCEAAEGTVPPSIVDLCVRQYGR
ncbi:hypothetical protein ACQKM2_00245 [Streptomyces sp. NPDC004126]|uniref:hypothetical protein n=1 Tax=Streptomyces sp. NPDC004126 TaxID=3390695 RepID=UPI003D04B7AA